MDEKIYKSVSFRLGLGDEADQALYQRIIEASKHYSSVSAFARIVFEDYFQKLDERKRNEENLKSYERIEALLERHTVEIQSLITDGIQAEGMKLVGAMLSGLQGSITTQETETKRKDTKPVAILPDETDELPEDMSGVLDFLV